MYGSATLTFPILANTPFWTSLTSLKHLLYSERKEWAKEGILAYVQGHRCWTSEIFERSGSYKEGFDRQGTRPCILQAGLVKWEEFLVLLNSDCRLMQRRRAVSVTESEKRYLTRGGEAWCVLNAGFVKRLISFSFNQLKRILARYSKFCSIWVRPHYRLGLSISGWYGLRHEIQLRSFTAILPSLPLAPITL